MDRSILVLLSSAALMVVVVGACSARPGDYEEDFTQEVEQICAEYCQMNLDCREPPQFASDQECEDACLASTYIYNDTECGEGKRDMYGCVASQATCELFNDTYNVHADQYTCKAEKDRWVSLDCVQSDEDPFPQDRP